MSKYEPLWSYIKNNNQDSYKLAYEEIRSILGFEIDHSFLKYKKELLEYGYEVGKISMKEKSVIINRKEVIKWGTKEQKEFYFFGVYL